MKILYIFRTARKKILEGYFNKTDPSTMLYGLVELRNLGIEADFSDLAYNRFNLLHYLFLPMEILFIKLIRYPLGYKLHQALVLIPEYHKYNIIFCTQDSAGLPILLLKRLRLINNKVVYLCNNLAPLLDTKSRENLRKFFLWHLQAADSIVCLSGAEKKIIGRYFPKKTIYVPFGIDVNFFIPSPYKKFDFEILAVGRDFLRDYATLVQAIVNSKWRTAIVCSTDNLKGVSVPSTVSLFYDIKPLQLKELYAKSKIVIIPMKESVPKSQGQVVFLEASAMAKQVIASDVPGLTTAFNKERFSNLILVRPNDSEVLHGIIAKFLRNNIMKKHDHYSERKFISMKRFAEDLYKVFQTL